MLKPEKEEMSDSVWHLVTTGSWGILRSEQPCPSELWQRPGHEALGLAGIVTEVRYKMVAWCLSPLNL